MKISVGKKAILALICVNILWGVALPVYRWALSDIPPFTFAFIRFLIPSIGILLFYRGSLRLRWKDVFKVFTMATLLITYSISFLFLGLQRTLSIDASIILSGAPIFLTLASLIFLKEKIKKRAFIGYVFGFFGVLLIVFQPMFQSLSHVSVMGNIALIISGLTDITGIVLAKQLLKRYSPMTLAFWIFTIAAVSFAPLWLWEGHIRSYHFVLNLQAIVGILYACVFSSMVCYFFFMWALKYSPASQTGVFSYIDPFATMLVALPLLHEPITSTFVLGAFLVFFGIYIAEKRIHYHPVHRLFE